MTDRAHSTLAGVIILATTFVLGFGIISAVLAGNLDRMDNQTKQIGTQACQETFGESYTYSGNYLAGNPPTIQCEANGNVAYMDMPEAMAEQKNINATAYNND